MRISLFPVFPLFGILSAAVMLLVANGGPTVANLVPSCAKFATAYQFCGYVGSLQPSKHFETCLFYLKFFGSQADASTRDVSTPTWPNVGPT